MDRLASRVARHAAQLDDCAVLLWSDRPEDAPRRWTALQELGRLAEAAAALRAEAGLPPAAASSSTVSEADLGGGRALAAAPGTGLLAAAVGGAGDEGSGEGEDESVVCTREAGGVQRRVAGVLLGGLELGVRALEAYTGATLRPY
jgi:hypothetical protein